MLCKILIYKIIIATDSSIATNQLISVGIYKLITFNVCLELLVQSVSCKHSTCEIPCSALGREMMSRCCYHHFVKYTLNFN